MLARASSWAEPFTDAKTGKRSVSLRPLYSCRSLCKREPGNSGDPVLRAAYRCSLPDFDPEAWDHRAEPYAAADAERLTSDLIAEAAMQGVDLAFDLAEHGCPWGWANSRFATLTREYVGERTLDDPRRGMALDLEWLMRRATEKPTRIIDLVKHYTRHEDAALSAYHRKLGG